MLRRLVYGCVLFLAALVLTACSDDVEVAVAVCGNLAPGVINQLMFQTLDEDDVTISATTLDLEGFELPIETTLPARPGSGYVRVDGASDFSPRVSALVQVSDFEEIDRVDIVFAPDCIGAVNCPEGQTCVSPEEGAAECVRAPVAEGSGQCPD